MANQLLDFKVTGVQELASNLAKFGSPRTLGKMVDMTMRAGALPILQRARLNARALGLGFIGFKPRRAEGLASKGQSRRYGRIPPSLKSGRAYIPTKSGIRNAYRLNVMARGQQRRGIFRNRAPHAHLIEYGYTHVGSGRSIAGRPFMGPALDQTAVQVVQIMAERFSGLVDGLKFPTTGKGP